jgi:hypothetical protein
MYYTCSWLCVTLAYPITVVYPDVVISTDASLSVVCNIYND